MFISARILRNIVVNLKIFIEKVYTVVCSILISAKAQVSFNKKKVFSEVRKNYMLQKTGFAWNLD